VLFFCTKYIISYGEIVCGRPHGLPLKLLNKFRWNSVLDATCLLAGLLNYSSTLKMGRDVPPKRRVQLYGLHGVISQKMIVFEFNCDSYWSFTFIFSLRVKEEVSHLCETTGTMSVLYRPIQSLCLRYLFTSSSFQNILILVHCRKILGLYFFHMIHSLVSAVFSCNYLSSMFKIQL
jgi:hypothetical protein